MNKFNELKKYIESLDVFEYLDNRDDFIRCKLIGTRYFVTASPSSFGVEQIFIQWGLVDDIGCCIPVKFTDVHLFVEISNLVAPVMKGNIDLVSTLRNLESHLESLA